MRRSYKNKFVSLDTPTNRNHHFRRSFIDPFKGYPRLPRAEWVMSNDLEFNTNTAGARTQLVFYVDDLLLGSTGDSIVGRVLFEA